MDFKSPLLISIGFKRDKIRLLIKDNSMFVSNITGDKLENQGSFEMEKSVPKQLPAGVSE